jgi:sarcosine oxidase subunit gamma
VTAERDAVPTLQRRSPLGALVETPAPLAVAGGIELVERPFRPQVVVRLDLTAEASAALQTAVGVAPSDRPNRAASAGPGRLTAIWLGPDEWLFAMDHATLSGRALDARLAEIVRPFGGTTVDVSAQRTVLEVSGPRARDLLAAGTSIDLHPRFFAIGDVAQTQLARVDVILTRAGDETYQVFVRASFARYVADWLIDALANIEGEGS